MTVTHVTQSHGGGTAHLRANRAQGLTIIVINLNNSGVGATRGNPEVCCPLCDHEVYCELLSVLHHTVVSSGDLEGSHVGPGEEDRGNGRGVVYQLCSG